MFINDNIKSVRKTQGITQLELAEKLNISQAAVNSYENNTENFKVETLEKIAAALNVTLIDLIQCDAAKIKKDNMTNKLLNRFDKLNDKGKHLVITYIDTILHSEKYIK